MVTQERFFTVEEFWEYSHLPENEGRHLELVEGELREMAPSGGEHGEVTFDFGLHIGNFVKQHKLGRVTAAETGYILYKNPDPNGKNTVRAPDIGFVRIERIPEPFAEKFIPIVPDLAAEVVSPNDRAEEIEEKVTQYLHYGVRLVWVLYPATKTIIVHKSNSMRRLNIESTLDGEEVLPGFMLKVSEIFPA